MAERIHSVNDDYSSAGQLTPAQIQAASEQGFCSILNLRSPDEEGVLDDEAGQAVAAGLYYAQTPVSTTDAEAGLLDKALLTLASLPKPVLIHCRSGGRATAIALIAIAQQTNFSREQFVQQVQTHGLSLEQPQIKQFLSDRYSPELRR